MIMHILDMQGICCRGFFCFISLSCRTYVAFDIMQRILTDVFGVPVHHVMGMTDVDDKIVKRAAADGIPFIDLARKYEAGFQQDMTDLGVRPPSAITRVSEHIPEIIRYCEKILENGV